MLDGNPFQLLNISDVGTEKEIRERRNNAVAQLKEEDKLADHVCDSLRDSADLNDAHLEMLDRVIRMTLAKDPWQREIGMARIIRFLSPDLWYQSR